MTLTMCSLIFSFSTSWDSAWPGGYGDRQEANGSGRERKVADDGWLVIVKGWKTGDRIREMRKKVMLRECARAVYREEFDGHVHDGFIMSPADYLDGRMRNLIGVLGRPMELNEVFEIDGGRLLHLLVHTGCCNERQDRDSKPCLRGRTPKKRLCLLPRFGICSE